jgi:hypothetical protein
MTATFTEKRRPGPTPPRPLRELPVLFHLMDVSRPKGYAAPEFTLAPPVERVTEPADLVTPAPEASPALRDLCAGDPACDLQAAAFDLETAASLVETKGFGAIPPPTPLAPPTSENLPIDTSPVESEPLLGAAAELVESGAESASAEELFASELAKSEREAAAELAVASETTAVADETDRVFEDSPAAESEDPVSLRERSEERQRKRQASAKNDWFSTQGKFIAIAFVLALFTTIYAARANRSKTVPATGRDKTSTASTAPSSGNLTPVVAAPSKTGVSPVGAITTVSPTEKPQPEESRTALHPPTIPQLDVEPALNNPPTGDALFTFAKKDEERVAQRDGNASTSQPTSGNAAEAQPLPSSSTPVSPTAQPHYPTTSYGGNYQPAAPAAPSAAAPTQQYAVPPQYAAPPQHTAPPQYTVPPQTNVTPPPTAAAPSAPQSIYQPAAPGTAATSSPQYYPTTNTATGPRHERNGSGIY